MIAATIFLLLLATLWSFRRGRGDLGRLMFAISFVAVLLLFMHHVTDPLNLSF